MLIGMDPVEELRYLVLAVQRDGNRALAALLRPLGVTPAQAEVILYARTSGVLDAILRSPTDAGQTAETTGVILKTLVDLYGILPPEIVQVPIPTPLGK